MRDLISGPGATTESLETVVTTGSGTERTPLGDREVRFNQRHTIGVDVPGFRAKQRRGELLPHTYFKQFDCYGSCWGALSTVSTGVTTSIQPLWVADGWQITEEELFGRLNEFDAQPFVDATAAKIYASGHDTLTFLAELKHVVRMFRGIVPRILQYIRDPKTVGRLGEKLGDDYLQGRYGWRTLLYDIEDLNKALKSLSVNKRSRFADRTGTKHNWVEVTQTVGYATSCDTTYTLTDTFEVGLRGSIVADISPPAFAFNPVTTAWELTRLSFVVDWIVNIGQFLESMSFLALSSSYSAAAGYYIRCERKREVTNVAWHSGYSGERILNGESTAYAVLRLPTSVSKLPHIEVNLDWLKVGDLLALLRQALSK